MRGPPGWLRGGGAHCGLHGSRLNTKNGTMMTDTMMNPSLDELGPVDYVVVEFPTGATNFTGEMVKELLALVESGIVRVIDVLILTKNPDGSVEATELAD